MVYGTLVSLVFHNLPSLYPSSFCRNDFHYLFHLFFHGASPTKNNTDIQSCLLPTHHYNYAFAVIRALLWFTSGMIPTMAQKYSHVFHFSFDCLQGHGRFQQFSNHMQICCLDVCCSMSSCETIKACTKCLGDCP